ncbi:MAG: hypothetical protein HZB41_01775 [Ignavibacteriae bacterium]|nr:hypothetical protein [Ignavibacteriota bacterium]
MRNSKLKLVIFLFTFLFFSCSSPKFELIKEFQKEYKFNGMKFIDSTNGYIIGVNNGVNKSALLLKTIDGGDNWTEIPLDLKSNLFKIFFLDKNYGWILGTDKLLSTSNGGESWNKIDLVESQINNLQFNTDKIGWASADSGKILYTYDGGKNWIIKYNLNKISRREFENDNNLKRDVHNLFFLNKDTGWVIGESIVVETNDGGNNWRIIGTNREKNYGNIVYFFNKDTGLVSIHGYSPILITNYTHPFNQINRAFLKTNNGGKDWYYSRVEWSQDNGVSYLNSEPFFLNKELGWAIGMCCTILQTEDGGDSWRNFGWQSDHGIDEFISLYIKNENYGIFITNHSIFKLYK